MREIDLNADVGEGVGDDASLIPLVTSASIACGAHAGDEATMASAIAAAAEAGVAIGAHPGHTDRPSFGRRVVQLTAGELETLVAPQVERLQELAQRCGQTVRYVKLHGALYHQAAADGSLAEATVRAVRRAGQELWLLGPPATPLAAAAKAAGTRYAAEGFADRRYLRGGGLAPRSERGALLADAGLVAEQAALIAVRGEAVAAGGGRAAVACDSLCLHGDREGAAGIAREVRRALALVGVGLRPFARGPGEGAANGH